MRRIYMHGNERFEVFTTVLAPQGRYRHRAEAEKMVVVHSHRPHWPDELELSPGDVVTVLSQQEEEGRWFGRLQDGPRRGFFPASCVMELSQVTLPPKALRGSLSPRSSAWDEPGVRGRHGECVYKLTLQPYGHILQALRRGGGGGGGIGGAAGLDGGQGENGGPSLVPRPQIPAPRPMASRPQTCRSPGLLRRILSKCRRKTECQGASNEAFEGD